MDWKKNEVIKPAGEGGFPAFLIRTLQNKLEPIQVRAELIMSGFSIKPTILKQTEFIMIFDNIVFERSFDSDFQAALRFHLEPRVNWVAHRTTVRRLVSIKSTGLEPRTGALYIPPSVIARFGACPKVSCLAPCAGRHRWEHLQHHDGKQVYLFMRLASVPSPIGIDWTFPPVWNAVAEQSKSDNSTPSEHLFARSIIRESVFVTYGVIPSRELFLIGPNSDIENPETFLQLSEIKDSEIDKLPS